MYKIDSKREKPDLGYLERYLGEQMRLGIRVKNLEEVHSKYNEQKEDLKKHIQRTYGIKNPNSSQQVITYLNNLNNMEVYEACHIDDKWTTNKEVMSELSSLGYEFADDLLEYRKAKKYEETVRSLMESVDSNGLVHPDISVSKTNRINYTNPSLMNIPKDILWEVIAPRNSKNILYSVDIKNQEPNILINLLDVKELKSALTDDRGLYEALFQKPFKIEAHGYLWVIDSESPRDISEEELVLSEKIPTYMYNMENLKFGNVTYKGKKVLGVKPFNRIVNSNNIELPKDVTVVFEDRTEDKVNVQWESKKITKTGISKFTGEIKDFTIECDRVARNEFKVAWNAMTYGASILGIRKICKHIDADSLYNYFSKIPELKEYRLKCHRMGKDGEQRIKTYFGTELYADRYGSQLKRALMDLPIQGTGTDILSLLVKHFNEASENNMFIYYTRHDELIIEVDGDTNEEITIETLKGLLEHQVDDWVPFKVDIKRVA